MQNSIRIQLIRLLKKGWQDGQIMIVGPVNAEATEKCNAIHGNDELVSDSSDIEAEARALPNRNIDEDTVITTDDLDPTIAD